MRFLSICGCCHSFLLPYLICCPKPLVSSWMPSRLLHYVFLTFLVGCSSDLSSLPTSQASSLRTNTPSSLLSTFQSLCPLELGWCPPTNDATPGTPVLYSGPILALETCSMPSGPGPLLPTRPKVSGGQCLWLLTYVSFGDWEALGPIPGGRFPDLFSHLYNGKWTTFCGDWQPHTHHGVGQMLWEGGLALSPPQRP